MAQRFLSHFFSCFFSGVKIYNVKSGQKVTYVARPSRSKGSLTWLSDDQLAMSWGSLVKIAVLITAGDLQTAEVRHQFNCSDVTSDAQVL